MHFLKTQLFQKTQLQKAESNTQLFQKTLFKNFYQTLSFLKKHFFIMHFLKTQLFQKAQLQKAEPNSP